MVLIHPRNSMQISFVMACIFFDNAKYYIGELLVVTCHSEGELCWMIFEYAHTAIVARIFRSKVRGWATCLCIDAMYFIKQYQRGIINLLKVGFVTLIHYPEDEVISSKFHVRITRYCLDITCLFNPPAPPLPLPALSSLDSVFFTTIDRQALLPRRIVCPS